MSSSFHSRLATVAAIILTTVIAAQPAKADSYQITIVDLTQSANFMGIDDMGDFVVNDSNNANKCGESDPFNPCFEVVLIGQSPIFTTTSGTLSFLWASLIRSDPDFPNRDAIFPDFLEIRISCPL